MIIVIKEFKGLMEIINGSVFWIEEKQREIVKWIKHFCKCTKRGYKDFLEELFEVSGQRIEIGSFKSMLAKNIILKKYRRGLALYILDIITRLRIIKFVNVNICYETFEWLREEIGSEYFEFNKEDFVKGTKGIKKVSNFIKFLTNHGYTCSDIFIRGKEDVYETMIPSSWTIKVGIEFDYLGRYKVANLMDIQELEDNNYTYLIKELKEEENGNIRQWG